MSNRPEQIKKWDKYMKEVQSAPDTKEELWSPEKLKEAIHDVFRWLISHGKHLETPELKKNISTEFPEFTKEFPSIVDVILSGEIHMLEMILNQYAQFYLGEKSRDDASKEVGHVLYNTYVKSKEKDTMKDM